LDIIRGESALQAYAGLEIGGVRMDMKGGGPQPAYPGLDIGLYEIR
jgi:hypothetical protein